MIKNDPSCMIGLFFNEDNPQKVKIIVIFLSILIHTRFKLINASIYIVTYKINIARGKGIKMGEKHEMVS